MKVVLAFLIVFSISCLATAQKKSAPTLITEEFNDVSLKTVLVILQEKYNITTAYGDQLVEDHKVTASFDQEKIPIVIKFILQNTNLSFEMMEDDLVIIKEKTYGDSHALYTDLSGSLTDGTSGESLPYAYVWLDDVNRSLITNVDGYFSLPNTKLPLSLKISYLGYQDTTIVIPAYAEKEVLNIQLTPKSQSLDEVVISQSHTDNFEIDEVAGKVTFNPAIAAIVPAAGEVDVFRSLQLLPGITATNETSSGLSIRGGTSTQNLVLLDGFTVYHVDHFFGYFSAFNPYAIKSMQVYKSGYGASFGGRVSSIVDITTKDGNKHKTAGSLGLNLMSINSTLEVPLSENNTTLFFSARRSFTDLYTTQLFEDIFTNFSSSLGNENVNNQGSMSAPPRRPNERDINNQSISTESSSIDPTFYYSDLNVKVSSNLNDKNRIAFSFYNSKDILNFTELSTLNINDTLQVDMKSIGIINWGNIGSSLKFSRVWSHRHFSNFLLSYSQYNSKYNDITTSTSIGQDETTVANSSSSQNNGMRDISLKWDHEIQTLKSDMIKVGFSSSLYRTTYEHLADGESIVNENIKNETLTNGYVEYNFNPLSNVSMSLGLRGSYFSPTSEVYVVPRVSLRYLLTPNVTLTAAYGQYNQFINQINTKNVLQGSRDFWLLANDKRIPIQHATHYTAGISYQKNDLTLSAEIYSKQFDGLMEYAFRNGGLVTEFQNFDQLFFTGEGYSNGMEFLVKKEYQSFQAWIGYTVSQVVYQFDQINAGNAYYADHDQRHEVNIYSAYNYKRFTFFATWLYGSGAPYSLVDAASFGSDTQAKFGSRVSVLEVTAKNSERLPAYHRLDVGATYTFEMGKLKTEATLSIFNLYNRTNVQDRKINQIMPGRTSNTRMRAPIIQTTDVTLLGISPNIALRVTF